MYILRTPYIGTQDVTPLADLVRGWGPSIDMWDQFPVWALHTRSIRLCFTLLLCVSLREGRVLLFLCRENT